MRFRQDENGQMLVLTALSLIALLGFMALAVDVGVLFRARRNMQIAADAAAMAGALDYLYNSSTSSAATAAANAASANGVTTSYTVTANTACPNTNQNCVVVNIPATGPTSTEPFAVEAKVSTPNPTFFMRMFGASNMVVGARAVAASPTIGSACIWAMAQTGNGLKLQGSYNIQSPGCGIYVNSTSSNAINVIGNGGIVNSKYIAVVGGNVGSNHVTSPTGETLNSPPMTPPWGNPSGPTPSTACSSLTSTTGNSISSATVTQAQINAAVTASTNGVVCLTANNVTLSATNMWGSASGITYLYTGTGSLTTGNSMTFGGDSSGNGIPTYNTTTQEFSGTTYGATLDIYQGTFNQNNQTLSMYAPTSNSQGIDGIAIFQPPANPNELQIQFGSGNEVLDGYIYAPGAEVFMQDSGGSVIATGIVGATIFEKTTSLTIANSYDNANPSTTLNRVVTLVE